MKTTTLINSKLHAPRIAGGLVKRTTLLTSLDQASDRKLILVAAPAGFGKTTLVVDWLERAETPYAWVSLDEQDNELTRFLAYLVAAVQTVYPDVCATSQSLLASPESPSVEQLVTGMVNDLLELPEPLPLAIDDYHLVEDATIHRWMELFIRHMPHSVRLVLISRVDPFLSLARLRARHHLMEVRAQGLRFSDNEAEEFLRLNSPVNLDQVTARQLNGHTEGWAAGLRMAALSLRSGEDSEAWLARFLAQSDKFAVDYLFTEVLANQTPAVRDFLLRTSLPDRFNLDLYEALADHHETAAEMVATLDTIKIKNLFLLPLDEEGEWYRYHHLFRDMLRQTLHNEMEPEDVAGLHLRAAHWFAENGHSGEALHHAVVAGDMEMAVDIVEARSHNLLNGRERRELEHWMATLPESLIWQRPRLLLVRAWLLYRHWRLRAMESVLQRMELCLLEFDWIDEEERAYLACQIHTLRSATDLHVQQDYTAAIQHAQTAIDTLPPSEAGALGTAYASLGLGLVGLDRIEEATRALDEVLQNPGPVAPARVQLLLGASAVHCVSGNAVAFQQMVDRLLALKANSMLPGRWFGGALNYELNNLDQAAADSEIMYQNGHISNYLGEFYGGLLVARVWQLRGDFDTAQTRLDALREATQKVENSALLDSLDAHQAWQLLLTDDRGAAYRWARTFQPGLSPDNLFEFDTPTNLWARIMLTCGDKADKRLVATTLQTRLDRLTGTGFRRWKLQLGTHLAVALAACGERHAALQTLDQAVRLGQETGYVRSILDVGDGLHDLLGDLDLQAYAPGYVSNLRSESAPALPSSDAAATLVTERELEVLRMMATTRTNQEIANDLVISLHTAKRHASNIYSKLNVGNRRQAVSRAKELGILPR